MILQNVDKLNPAPVIIFLNDTLKEWLMQEFQYILTSVFSIANNTWLILTFEALKVEFTGIAAIR